MLFSNFGCCISEGSLFRLFNSRDVLFCHGLTCKNPKWVKHFYKTPVKTFTHIHKRIFMSPQPKGRGTYCFWCGSRRCWRRRPRCSLSAPYRLKFRTNGWILTKLAQTHYWEGRKKWLDFGDLDLIFKVTPALWNFQILTRNLICTLSLEPNDGFWPTCLHPISWTK